MPARNEIQPADPVAAATHDDPRSYYAALAERELFFDPALRCWIASSAQAVGAALSHPALRVRPLAEPVPIALLDTGAAKLFASLVRMTDGPGHGPLKAALEAALASVSEADICQSAIDAIPALALPTSPSGAEITRFNYALPTVVLAHWIGIPRESWGALVDEVLAFVRCIAPGGSDAEIAAGIQAAAQLEQRVRHQLHAPGPLLQQLVTEFERTGLPDVQTLLIANVVGLWFQACEGCAGLIGQALMLANGSGAQSSALDLVDAVLDATPPIQNTRRFAAAGVSIAGCPMHAGDVLLAVLPAKDEMTQQHFAFGHGQHACPGARWARSIAIAGIEFLLQAGIGQKVLQQRWRRSLNARVPEFF
ncbi:cytochrome P450 [Aquitalea sp. S1-19]|nr:cytochrome P450 [Aquitalea sp. S1-19]